MSILSIIIPSCNAEEHFDFCLETVRKNFCEEVEIILVDGNSTDNTLAIASSHSELFSKQIVENDSGQSEAINKGFQIASGEYITWLNADDALCPRVLNRVISFLRDKKTDWLTLNQVYINQFNIIQKCLRSGPFEETLFPKGILHVFGPSTIMSRSMVDDLGPFDQSLHYCMDTEYWFRAAAAGYRYHRLPFYLWAFRVHEGSKTSGSLCGSGAPKRMMEEHREAVRRHVGDVPEKAYRSALRKARLGRILRGPYIRSYLDTLRYRGKPLEALKP